MIDRTEWGIEKIESLGYTFEEILYDGDIQYFKFVDENGYEYIYGHADILGGKILPFFKRNPSTLKNIQHLIDINFDGKYVLLEDNIYENGKSKLNLFCRECSKIFVKTYVQIRSGIFYHKCGILEEVSDIPKEPYRPISNKLMSVYHPELLLDWDYENNGNPDTYGLHSKKKVSWICHVCGYRWVTQVRARTRGYGCQKCSWRKRESSIEEKVREYLEILGYTILHEGECSLQPISPKTNYKLFYDNEIYDLHAIIEVHGEQHYIEKSGLHRFLAKKKKISMSEAFDDLKYRDEYKKSYALENGYYYLEIPHWDVENGRYKQTIDDFVENIVSGQV